MPAVDGQSILVTGAAEGLGAAIARHLHGQGARLILMDRDEEGLTETAAACSGAPCAVVDLADAEATERAIAETVRGPVDTLIHNAAQNTRRGFCLPLVEQRLQHRSSLEFRSDCCVLTG